MHSRSKLNLGSSCGTKLPKTNWQHHAAAFEDLSCQGKYLSSGFLFSLPSQKPCAEERAEGVSSTRYIDVEGPNPHVCLKI